MTTQNISPQRPDVDIPLPPVPGMPLLPTPEPKKKHTARKVVGIIIAVFVVGAVLNAMSGDSTPKTTAPDDTKVACIDATAGMNAMDQAQSDLTDAMTAASTADAAGAATALSAAADDVRTAAEAAQADPSIEVPLRTAANELDRAANQTAAGNIGAASSTLEKVVPELNAATTAMDNTTVPAC
jgi:hypothetical protein